MKMKLYIVHIFGFNLEDKRVKIPKIQLNKLKRVLKWNMTYRRVSGAALEWLGGKNALVTI